MFLACIVGVQANGLISQGRRVAWNQIVQQQILAKRHGGTGQWVVYDRRLGTDALDKDPELIDIQVWCWPDSNAATGISHALPERSNNRSLGLEKWVSDMIHDGPCHCAGYSSTVNQNLASIGIEHH
jgi:hypothetical protein